MAASVEQFDTTPLTPDQRAIVVAFGRELGTCRVTGVRIDGFAQRCGSQLYPLTAKILKSYNEYEETAFVEVRQAWLAVMFACGVSDILVNGTSDDLTEEAVKLLAEEVVPVIKSALEVKDTL
jgi:hypothetical protein